MWKLGEDLIPEDNIFDPISFDELIMAVQNDSIHLTRSTVERVAKNIMESRAQDFSFLLARNWVEIITEAKRRRGEAD